MRRVCGIFAAVIAVIAAASVGYLFYQGRVSSGDGFGPPGVVDGRLAACPAAPNCVCSRCAGGHAVAPLDAELAAARDALIALGGRVVSDDAGYVAATFTSTVFGFVDDVELRADEDAGVVHVRSASRVGYSDLDANRDRVEALRALLAR